LIFVFAAAAFAQRDIPVSFSPGVPGTGRQVSGGVGTPNSHVTVRCKTVLKWIGATPDNLARFGGSGTGFGPDTLHRVVVDKSAGAYFGYDLVFGAGDAADGYLATFQPPTGKFNLLQQRAGAAPLTPMPPPSYPAPQIVHDGDTLEIDLMASPDGQQKLTDYIEISLHDSGTPAVMAGVEPRDFTLDDGPIESYSGVFVVSKQRQRMPTSLPFDGKKGATLWVAVPGQGRYILSLTPQDGFTKAGAIRGNVISFQDAGQEYEVRLMTYITGSAKPWNLYMLHDLTYHTGPAAKAGTDRLENLLPKP
jgi:hypothetical protein